MKSGQRIAIARRSRAAVAHACHAMGAGWLRRLANALRSTRLPDARLVGLCQTMYRARSWGDAEWKSVEQRIPITWGKDEKGGARHGRPSLPGASTRAAMEAA
jgi:hypothetical protein